MLHAVGQLKPTTLSTPLPPPTDSKARRLAGFSSFGSARSGVGGPGPSTHRSQTDAANVSISQTGHMVPVRPTTAVDGAAGSMYASDSNNFDVPVPAPVSVPAAGEVGMLMEGPRSLTNEEKNNPDELNIDAKVMLTPSKKPRAATAADPYGDDDDASLDSKATKRSAFSATSSQRSNKKSSRGRATESVLSGSKNSPTKVVPGQGWAANGNIPDSARSQLTHSTMDSDDLNDLVSGELHRSRKVNDSRYEYE